jgi:hypothetical protein
LVDSDVLIEHLRGKTAARDWLYPMFPGLARPF